MWQQQVDLFLGHASDSEAHIYIRACDNSTIARIEGTLRGPSCDYARTLPGECALRTLPDRLDHACLAEALLVDPCYWTPDLPFRYELHLRLTRRDGTSHSVRQIVGFRRWAADNSILRLERKRSVIRGCQALAVTTERLQEARDVKSALLIAPPHEQVAAAASRLGVSLVVDLSRCNGSLSSNLQRLNWQTSAMIAILSPRQLADQGLRRAPCLLAAQVSANSLVSEFKLADCDLLAVDLAPGETPPTWIANCGKPAIAIRHGHPYANIAQGRAACDRLQTELAPQFDLAGYFVSP